MNERYLVIKQHLNGYNHKAFATVDEAHAVIDNAPADFQGDYAAIYDLQSRTYMHIEAFPGMDSNAIQQIIKQYLQPII